MSDILTELIARTIKEADTSYFWENYTKQAMAVRKVLKAAGYVIVPENPSQKMIDAGINRIMVGRTHAEDLTQKIYTAMIQSASSNNISKK